MIAPSLAALSFAVCCIAVCFHGRSSCSFSGSFIVAPTPSLKHTLHLPGYPHLPRACRPHSNSINTTTARLHLFTHIATATAPTAHDSYCTEVSHCGPCWSNSNELCHDERHHIPRPCLCHSDLTGPAGSIDMLLANRLRTAVAALLTPRTRARTTGHTATARAAPTHTLERFLHQAHQCPWSETQSCAASRRHPRMNWAGSAV